MNQKENLEEEVKKYYIKQGYLYAYLVIATACSFLILFYPVFIGVVIACLILIIMCLREMEKLNLKWTANYEQKQQGKFCRYCGNKKENKN